jgi:hypothetical protein
MCSTKLGVLILAIIISTAGCGKAFEAYVVPAPTDTSQQSASGDNPIKQPPPGGETGPTPSPSPTPPGTPGSPIVLPSANLVDNPGFENDFAAWEDWGNSTVLTIGPRTGAKALRVSGSGGRGQELIYRLKTGATYRLTGYGRVASLIDTAYIGIRFFDLGNATMGDVRVKVDTLTFSAFTVDFVVPPQVSSAKVYLTLQADGLTADFDDVNLRMIGAPVNPAPLPAVANPNGYTPTVPVKTGYRMVMSEEFTAPTLNTSMWNIGFWFSYTLRNELQAYRPENVRSEAGLLNLVGERRSTTTLWGEPMGYASGAVTTRNKFTFTFGVVEARMKVPRGRGFAPAFWLLPNLKRSPPEINIAEILGFDTTTTRMNYKWLNGSGIPMGQPMVASTADYSADFHVFTLEWLPERMNYYIDGVLTGTYTGEFVLRDPAFILLNLSLGGDVAGVPDAGTTFPQAFQVDYVRVFQKPL